MIVIFLLLLLAGLGAFVLVFMKALKGNVPVQVSLQDIEPSRPVPEPSADIPAGLSNGDLLKEQYQQILQKVSKQEELLEEKNRIIVALQESAHASHEQEGQIDNIRQILQSQIEELKAQNKKLKDELARVTDENMDLQTRVYAAQPAKVLAAPQPPAARESLPKATDPAGTLSLHDVFGGESGDVVPQN